MSVLHGITWGVRRATSHVFRLKIYRSLQIRGSRLKDSIDVAALKPCVLTLVEGGWSRVLDIYATKI